MAVERQIPGDVEVNETETAERQVPGGAFINETAGAAPTATGQYFDKSLNILAWF